MQEPIEEKKVGDLTVRVFYDDTCPSPRESDNLGTMICFHKIFNIGDKHNIPVEEAKKFCNSKTQISLPVFLYDHGCQILSTSSFACRAQHAAWDSGIVGWITVSKEKIAKEFGWKIIGKARRSKIYRLLDCEVEEYSQWMQGNCYLWEVTDAQDEFIEGVGGYIGEDCATCAFDDGMAAAEGLNSKGGEADGSKDNASVC